MRCYRCGEIIKRITNNQKYCRECGIIMNRIKSSKRIERKRNLGTSNFFEHKKQKNEQEYDEIQAEIKRLGFKRQFT